MPFEKPFRNHDKDTEASSLPAEIAAHMNAGDNKNVPDHSRIKPVAGKNLPRNLRATPRAEEDLQTKRKNNLGLSPDATDEVVRRAHLKSAQKSLKAGESTQQGRDPALDPELEEEDRQQLIKAYGLSKTATWEDLRHEAARREGLPQDATWEKIWKASVRAGEKGHNWRDDILPQEPPNLNELDEPGNFSW